MTSLVENLLTLARSDGGAEAISLAPIRLELLLRRACEAWTIAANKASVNLQVRVPSADLFVLCDENGIQRLLSILLENGVKYTPPGGNVAIFAEAEEERISISVSDTGIGIANEYQDRIFERFFRGAAKSGNFIGGSGLGLALAKWVADCHGTELRVKSELGNGSCFTFSLERTAPPRRTDDEETISNHAQLSRSVTLSSASL